MAMRHVTVIGTTKPQIFQMRSDGLPMNGTGHTIAIAFRISELTAAQIAGTSQVVAAWFTQATGKVQVTGHDMLPLGNYYGRFVLDGANDEFIPGDESAFLWRVVRV